MTNDFLPPDLSGDDAENAQSVMTWTGHLSELRARLLKTLLFFALVFLALYPFAGRILDLLMFPLAQAMEKTGGSQRVIFTGLAEGFLTHLKLAAFGAAVFSFPFAAFQVWRFIICLLYTSPSPRDA